MPSESVELLFKFVSQGQDQLDKATASINKVTGASGNAGRTFDDLGGKIRSGFQNPLSTATQALDGMLGKLGTGGVIAGGFGLAIGLAGQQAIAFVRAQGAAAEQTVNFADRLGIAIGRAEQLQAEMRIAGVSAGALEGAVRGLSLALEDPAGAGEKTVAALRGIGVATLELTGSQRELGPVLLDVLKKLAAIGSDSERVAAAQRTLGRAAAVELLPWIKNLDDLEKKIAEIGVGLDDNLTQKLADSDDQFGLLMERWEQAKKLLVAPLLAPVNSLLGAVGFVLSGGVREPSSYSREPLVPFKNTQSFGIDVLTPERQIESSYLRGTPRGLQRQLKSLQEELGGQESIIFGTGAGTDAKSAAVVKAKSLAAQIAAIEKTLSEIGKKPYVDVKATISDLLNIKPMGLRDIGPLPAGQVRIGAEIDRLAEMYDSFRAIEESMPDINAEIARATAVSAESAGSILDYVKLVTAEFEKQEKLYEARVTAAVRIAELGDNEYQNAVRVRDIKLDAARDDVDRQQAELDFQVRVLELEKQRADRYKEQARGVFRSLVQGGGGLDALLKTGGTQLLEQLFVNASGSLFKSAGGTLGKAGALSGLNKIPGLEGLLKGTLFDPANGNPIEDNTSVTRANTAATIALTRSMSGGGVPSSLDGIFSGVSSNPLIFRNNGGDFGANGEWGTPVGPSNGIGTELYRGPSRLTRGIGIAGAAAGGAFGVYSGIKEGGIGGAITATGAASGATAGILMAAGATGPLAPILLGVGVGLSLIKTLLPDPSKQFAEEQDRVLTARRFTGATTQERYADFASSAESFDTDYKGRTRVQRTINLTVNAMDAASFKDFLATNAETVDGVVSDLMRSGAPGVTLGVTQIAFGPGAA